MRTLAPGGDRSHAAAGLMGRAGTRRSRASWCEWSRPGLGRMGRARQLEAGGGAARSARLRGGGRGAAACCSAPSCRICPTNDGGGRPHARGKVARSELAEPGRGGTNRGFEADRGNGRCRDRAGRCAEPGSHGSRVFCAFGPKSARAVDSTGTPAPGSAAGGGRRRAVRSPAIFLQALAVHDDQPPSESKRANWLRRYALRRESLIQSLARRRAGLDFGPESP